LGDIKEMITNSLSQDDIEKTRLAYQTTGTIKGSAKMLGIAHRTMQHRMKYIREDKPKFTAPELPSSLPSIEELLEQRTAQGDRSLAADDARHLIPIDVHIEGPYGLWIWGDPHVDADGCNMRLLREHVELAKHPAILSGHIGDIANFWVGRLARLYAHQSTSVHEAIMLAEWLLTQHEQLFVTLGNHDSWCGSGLENPLNWILRNAGGVTEEHGVRLALKSPNGVVTRVNARHDFPGRSQYNINHGMRRELAFGHRDHILVSGHLHSGGDQGLCHDGDGMVSQLVRVSGYKQVDHYAKQLNFPPQKIHPSALIIVDPREPETSRGRVWCAPTVEMGVKLLNAIRADYEASKEASNAAKRQPNSSVDKKRITRKSSR
jgi:hypothetical protein